MDALLLLTLAAQAREVAPAVDFSQLPASAARRGPDNAGKPHPVLARLLTDADALPPGGKARVGVLLVQDQGWHTYWKSPGDIGLPTTIAWQAPAGVSIAPHAFPLPERFDQDGQVSYGYEHQVLLISEVTVAPDAPAGRHTLSADVDWLVCLTSCIPGKAHLELPIQVAAGPTRPSRYGPLFDWYATQLPVAAEAVLDAEISVDPAAVPTKGPFRATFDLAPREGAFAASGPGGWPAFVPLVPADYSWAPTKVTVDAQPGGKLRVTLEAETYDPSPVPEDARLGALVQLEVGGRRVGAEVSTPLAFAPTAAAVASEAPPPAPILAAAVAAPTTGGLSLAFALLFGFVGGLILNAMPCVLPVLTLKLYGLVEQQDITPADRRVAGFAYTAGVLASFLGLAATIAVVRTAFGVELSWGSQFQYPAYVATLATIVFAFGLSLLGVFEIPAIGADAADRASSREGMFGTFLTGVFATLLATPCSAPVLGSAVAYAVSAPTHEMFAIFCMIGAGLAAPFLLVALVPALFRFLPRPGPWMDVFKQVLGFTLIATTVWLVDVLLAQIGPDGAIGFLAFLVSVAVAAWAFGRWGGVAESGRRQLAAAAVAAAITAGGGYTFLDLALADEPECDTGEVKTELAWDDGIPWQAFSEARVQALAGRPVFIDFTADWCITCKANERTILETETVRTAMRDHGVVPLKADWTRRDEVITEWLRRHGRAGVPMYLVLPADAKQAPILLPEVITPGMVTEALAQAAGRES